MVSLLKLKNNKKGTKMQHTRIHFPHSIAPFSFISFLFSHVHTHTWNIYIFHFISLLFSLLLLFSFVIIIRTYIHTHILQKIRRASRMHRIACYCIQTRMKYKKNFIYCISSSSYICVLQKKNFLVGVCMTTCIRK